MNSVAFWDFAASIPQSVSEVCRSHERCFGIKLEWQPRTDGGAWAKRNWRGVPGICYTGETDTCQTGRMEAPQNVLYDETGGEFIFRQPRSEEELRQVIYAGMVDPFDEYGFDGHRRWTVVSVRQWWKDRQRVVKWIEKYADYPEWHCHEYGKQQQPVALAEFQLHLHHELAYFLRTFNFFLDNGRCSKADDRLPDLD